MTKRKPTKKKPSKKKPTKKKPTKKAANKTGRSKGEAKARKLIVEALAGTPLEEVEGLRFAKGSLPTLEPVAELPRLRALYFGCNAHPGDLEPLTRVPLLEALVLLTTRAKNLHALSRCSSLRHLVIGKSYPVLSELDLDLVSLDLGGVTRLGDPEPLEWGLRRHDIMLWGSPGAQTFGRGFALLRELGLTIRYSDLAQAALKDVSFLERFPDLRELHLGQPWGRPGSLRDISALAALTKLERCSIYFTQVSDLAPLRNARNLKALSVLKSPRVKSLAPIAEAAELELVAASETGVADLTPLRQHSHLRRARFNHCKVSDATPLFSCVRLEALELESTQISDLAGIEALQDLRVLKIGNTGVTDLSPLAALPKLEALDLFSCRVSSLASLEGLTSLRRLGLAGVSCPDVQSVAEALKARGCRVSHDPKETLFDVEP